MTTFKLYVEHLRTYGDKIALIDSTSGSQCTYTELVHRIEARAAWLHERQLTVGDRVVLLDMAGTEWVETFFACVGLGLIAVPLDHRMRDEMIDHVCELVEPQLVLTGTGSGKVRSVGGTPVGTLVNPFELESWPELEPDAPCEIVFTSGTWALPKGVTLSSTNILNNFQGVREAYNSKYSDTLLSILPLSHSYELMCGLIVPLAAGSTIVYLPTITAQLLTDTIRRYKVTMIVAVPRVLELLHKSILRALPKGVAPHAEQLIRSSERLPMPLARGLYSFVHRKLGPSLKTFVVGGAALNLELDRFFTGLGYKVVVGYGLSEASPVLTASSRRRTTPGDVGLALPNVTLCASSDGELVASGANIFLGYWPDLHRDTELHTGDLATIGDDGRVHISGRRKNLLVYPTGDKLFLEDVEFAANSLPGVTDSCAVNIGDDEDIVIGIGIAGDASATVVKEKLQAQFPNFVYIKLVQQYPAELPRTHTLKYDRAAIRTSLLAASTQE
jgi:long-chain acyl-CoA synthetase